MKTFEDLGLTLTENEDCITCHEGNCHANKLSVKDGYEYNVHISLNTEQNEVYITVCHLDGTEKYSKYFETEEDAVKFILSEFPDFRCF